MTDHRRTHTRLMGPLSDLFCNAFVLRVHKFVDVVIARALILLVKAFINGIYSLIERMTFLTYGATFLYFHKRDRFRLEERHFQKLFFKRKTHPS